MIAFVRFYSTLQDRRPSVTRISREGITPLGPRPCRLGSWIIHAALRICLAVAVACAEQTSAGAGGYRRAGSEHWLPLDAREVLSIDYGSKEPRRPYESRHAAGSVLLLSDPPDRRVVHELLSDDGCDRDISSCDVLFRVSGASGVSSETRGRGRLRRPS